MHLRFPEAGSLTAEGEEGFVSIFNGRDLSGWEGEQGFWTVEDGAITGYQADFDAANQWTGCLYDCNSHRADPDRVIAPQGQKVTIDADGNRTGSTIADPAELLEHVKKDDWNEYHVIARGPLITLKINGHIMSQVIDHEKGKAARSGILAIQLHGGEPMKVQVKNLRLKRLD